MRTLFVDTPIGTFRLLLNVGGTRVRRICLPSPDHDDDDTSEDALDATMRLSGSVQRLIFSMQRYFRGEAVEFDLSPLDRDAFTAFQRRVSDTVCGIPRGLTVSYGRVAELAGHPGAARAVGQAMTRNPFPIVIPCHRVVAADGLGGYGGGARAKRFLLELEKRQPQHD